MGISKKGGVEFEQMVVPAVIALAVVVAVGLFIWSFESGTEIKETKSEVKGIADQLLKPLKQVFGTKKTDATNTVSEGKPEEKAFEDAVEIIESFSKLSDGVRTGKTLKKTNSFLGLGRDYKIKISSEGKDVYVVLYDIEKNKLLKSEKIIFDKAVNTGYYSIGLLNRVFPKSRFSAEDVLVKADLNFYIDNGKAYVSKTRFDYEAKEIGFWAEGDKGWIFVK